MTQVSDTVQVLINESVSRATALWKAAQEGDVFLVSKGLLLNFNVFSLSMPTPLLAQLFLLPPAPLGPLELPAPRSTGFT